MACLRSVGFPLLMALLATALTACKQADRTAPVRFPNADPVVSEAPGARPAAPIRNHLVLSGWALGVVAPPNPALIDVSRIAAALPDGARLEIAGLVDATPLAEGARFATLCKTSSRDRHMALGEARACAVRQLLLDAGRQRGARFDIVVTRTVAGRNYNDPTQRGVMIHRLDAPLPETVGERNVAAR